MAVTALETRRGISQGRIEPSGTDPFEGLFVFVLGDDTEGRFGDFTDGDWISLAQDVDLTGLDTVRLSMATFRTPADIEGSGYAWELVGYVDAVEKVRVRGWPGWRTVSDFVIDVHAISGVHAIGLVLEFVAT